MKNIIMIFCFFSNSVFAHHTNEHTMLMQDSEQVIAETLQGSNPGSWILWLAVIILFALGLFKLIYKK